MIRFVYSSNQNLKIFGHCRFQARSKNKAKYWKFYPDSAIKNKSPDALTATNSFKT